MHLGSVIRGEAYKFKYIKSFVDEWVEQLKLSSKIIESESQSTYSAFVGGIIFK